MNILLKNEMPIISPVLTVICNVLGDGTYDSPGFSAYYCTYFVLDLVTKKVVGLWVATKQMVFMKEKK